MKYQFIDNLTSDVLFKSYGKNLKEVFENSALAMFEVICDIKKVQKKEKIQIEVKGKDARDLLFSWLQELIAEVDIQAMFFSKFNIIGISDTFLKAEVVGDAISPKLGKTVVKAVTNYKFDLEKKLDGFVATVSLDI